MQQRLPVVGESVWETADLADPSVWTAELDQLQRDELVVQGRRAAAAGRTVETLTAGDLPLAALDPFVEHAVHALRGGRGFVLLRGFPVEDLTPAEVELAYVGLGLRLGTPVGQDKKGALLGHVRDERVPRSGPAVRLYQTSQRQDFHTDGSDLVGLLCLQRALAGGESRIASAHAVYNEVLRTGPTCWRCSTRPSTGTATTSSRRGRTRSSRSHRSSTSTGSRGSSTSAGTSATPSATRRSRG